MIPLKSIVVFTWITVKNCVGHLSIRTILVILVAAAALVFIPYWVGLLVVGPILPPPIWCAGFLCIAAVIITISLLFTLYIWWSTRTKERK